MGDGSGSGAADSGTEQLLGSDTEGHGGHAGLGRGLACLLQRLTMRLAVVDGLGIEDDEGEAAGDPAGDRLGLHVERDGVQVAGLGDVARLLVGHASPDDGLAGRLGIGELSESAYRLLVLVAGDLELHAPVLAVSESGIHRLRGRAVVLGLDGDTAADAVGTVQCVGHAHLVDGLAAKGVSHRVGILGGKAMATTGVVLGPLLQVERLGAQRSAIGNTRVRFLFHKC